jgi:hypothetical protein
MAERGMQAARKCGGPGGPAAACGAARSSRHQPPFPRPRASPAASDRGRGAHLKEAVAGDAAGGRPTKRTTASVLEPFSCTTPPSCASSPYPHSCASLSPSPAPRPLAAAAAAARARHASRRRWKRSAAWRRGRTYHQAPMSARQAGQAQGVAVQGVSWPAAAALASAATAASVQKVGHAAMPCRPRLFLPAKTHYGAPPGTRPARRWRTAAPRAPGRWVAGRGQGGGGRGRWRGYIQAAGQSLGAGDRGARPGRLAPSFITRHVLARKRGIKVKMKGAQPTTR